jgi:hypothetical protein
MVELDSEWTPPPLVVELVWRRDEPLGPAAEWLGGVSPSTWADLAKATRARAAAEYSASHGHELSTPSALFHLGLPLVALRLFLRSRKAPAYAQRIGERFASACRRCPAVSGYTPSVGESIAAAPMIRALLARHPSCRSPSPA